MSILITAKKVSVENRLEILPRYFGRWAGNAEQHIYNSFSNMCPDYDGGYWEFYELSNKGFYMAPMSAERYHIQVISNGFDGTVSADAAGIIATLYTFNALCWSTSHDEFIDSYYLLRDFACVHQEAGRILAAID